MRRQKNPQTTDRHKRVPRDAPQRPLLRDAGQVILLYALTLVTASWIFPPHGLWPLAFVCLAPWAVATCRARRAWLVHWLSFLLGWGFFLFNLRWLDPVTRGGYVALAFYLAMYWPLAAWALRTGQRHGISPLWTLPVTWVACELLRAWVMTGFPWLFMSHALYAQLTFIQISDLTGAYGVSFLVALVNGVIVGLALRRWPAPGAPHRPRQLWIGAAVTVLALAGTLAYGRYRCGQDDFEPGPRVAVIQHDFSLRSAPPYGERAWVIFAEYVRLAADAAAERPDLLVFPETVWSSIQNKEFLSVEHNTLNGSSFPWQYGKLCHEAIAAFAVGDYVTVNRVLAEFERRYGSRRLRRLPVDGGPPVTVVVGAQSVEKFPEATYPKFKLYNSALVYDPRPDPDQTQRDQRYDKNHLVPFGEFVPFRYGRLHWLYRRLNKLSPMSRSGEFEYSSSPGTELTVFPLKTPAGTTRFGTPICYEDVMPYVIREFVWEGRQRRADFLINISNDGWYIYGNELPQHLAICAFRAVENRVGFARAVNTGISGFIDPNGRIYSVVEKDGQSFGPGIIGYQVDRVLLDRRTSFYGWTGDWFAGICLALTAALWVVAVVERWILSLRQWIANRRAKGGRRHAPAREAE